MRPEQQDDAKAVWEEELRRRDWGRVFLKYLRAAARLRAEYQLALEDLVWASGIQRDVAEDSLMDDLDWAVESLVERCPDPLLIQAAITETDAREMLDGQGAFHERTFELNEEQSAALTKEIEEAEADPESLRSHEELWAKIYAGIEEVRRRVDLGEYENRAQALNAIRNRASEDWCSKCTGTIRTRISMSVTGEAANSWPPNVELRATLVLKTQQPG